MTAPRSGFADVESQLGEPGQLGVSATLLDAAGEARDHLEYKAERRFPMASVVKVPIGMAFEMRSRRGEASFEEILTITSRTACPGPVSNPIDRMFYLPWRSRTETQKRLFDFMLVYSDNTSADSILLCAGGPTAISAFAASVGVEGIEIRRSISDLLTYYYDLPAPRLNRSELALVGTRLLTVRRLMRPFRCRPDKERRLVEARQDTCTPRAMTRLLKVVSADPRFERTRDGMRGCVTGAARIARGLERSGQRIRGFLHKTGTLGGIVNDVGIVERDDGHRIVVSVMTYCASVPLAAREEVVAQVADMIMKEFG